MAQRGARAVKRPRAPRPFSGTNLREAIGRRGLLPWRCVSLALAVTLALLGAAAGPAPVAAAWQQATTSGPTVTSDPELDAAWDRAGCNLNPGNPSCVIIGHAAACAELPSLPDCTADRDSDRCRDVAEVRVGLDPLDGADCIGDGDGSPLVNCLFLIGNERCRGDPGPALDVSPPIDCPPRERDPGCDGFAPETGQVDGHSQPGRA